MNRRCRFLDARGWLVVSLLGCCLALAGPVVLAAQSPPKQQPAPVLSPKDVARVGGLTIQRSIPVLRVTTRPPGTPIPRGAEPPPAPLPAELRNLRREALPSAPRLEPEIQRNLERVRAIGGPAPLTWTERRTILTRSGIPVPERPTPPREFTLTVRRPWIDGVAWLGFYAPIEVDAVGNEAVIPGGEGWIDLTLTLEADSRYLLDVAVSSDGAMTYRYLAAVADGRAPEIPLPAGGQHLLIVIETTEAGLAYQMVSSRGGFFGFDSLTVTKID
jgi:hypothetical protein